jgi:hypothetical protein
MLVLVWLGGMGVAYGLSLPLGERLRAGSSRPPRGEADLSRLSYERSSVVVSQTR